MQYLDLSDVIPDVYIAKEDANSLSIPVTIFEIEDAIKSTNPNKALGPKGFNAHFFKICWPIIVNVVCQGIIGFFKHGLMLKQLKATFIMLFPKGDNASSPDKYDLYL